MMQDIVTGLTVHMTDPDIAPVLCMCLAKLSEHPSNALAIIQSHVVAPLAFIASTFYEDQYAAEAVASLARPLSINLEVSLIVATAGCCGCSSSPSLPRPLPLLLPPSSTSFLGILTIP